MMKARVVKRRRARRGEEFWASRVFVYISGVTLKVSPTTFQLSPLHRAHLAMELDQELGVGLSADDVSGASIFDQVREELSLARVALDDAGED